MSFLIGLLMFALILNCLVVIMLVLVQLPKKDAGAGMAFGGGTADALFGAGSGNALTKITKWAAGIFLGLCLLVGHLESSHNADNGAAFMQQVELQRQQAQPPAMGTAPGSHPTTTQPASQFSIPLVPSSNAPATGK